MKVAHSLSISLSRALSLSFSTAHFRAEYPIYAANYSYKIQITRVQIFAKIDICLVQFMVLYAICWKGAQAHAVFWSLPAQWVFDIVGHRMIL